MGVSNWFWLINRNRLDESIQSYAIHETKRINQNKVEKQQRTYNNTLKYNNNKNNEKTKK